jgi:hypothetical protein
MVAYIEKLENEPVIAVDLDAITAYFRGFKTNIKLMSNNKIMSAHEKTKLNQ